MEAAKTDRELALEQELRLAVVLYGGVSLAIYMYGVAQELFNLVWSTAPSRSYADGEPPGDLALDRVDSTDAVYRELGRLLPLDGGDGADGPVRTRFVVDIISGTSAGGINGICLAKALAGEADLSQLKDIWVKEGDIGVLINQQDAKYRETPPSSLLSGRRMLDKLVRAITDMTPSRQGPSRLVDELDLWVTATDLEGLEIPIQIANTTANERRHANRYHFRYSAEDDRDDFDGSADGFIAYAARSTSAFPFAFAPVLLEDLDALEHVPDATWERFYSAYASAHPEFPRRAFSDGGILDNKPFSYATETLLNRYAPLPVTRKLLYVEPDPGGPKEPRERWNAIDTTQQALLGLPQQDQIRADVQTVLARNRTIERVRDVVAQAGGTAPEQGGLDAPAQAGPAYGVYRRLKVRGVVDYLTSLVVRAAGFDPGSDEDFAVHYLVRAWKEARFATEPGDGLESEDAFLQRFDMPYRLRRLDFLLGRIKELRSTDPEAVARVLEISGVDPAPVLAAQDRESDLIALRRKLANARRRVRQAERALVRRDGALRQALGALGIDREQLTQVLNGRTDEGMLAEARTVAVSEDFDGVAEIIRKALKAAAETLREDISEALRPPTDGREPATSLRVALRSAHDMFEAYDLPLYLVQYGTPVGETNPVDIVRISPREARTPAGATRDLRGLRLHHFGAFLDERWRRHDMVWGRLDGAACLIDALLPGDDRAGQLIEAAHRRILEEYRSELGDPSDTDVFEWFRDLQVSPHPEPEATAKALNRGAVVISRMVEDALPGGVGDTARPVVEGVRAALIEHDDAPAVEGVMDVVRSHRWFPIAIAAWLLLVIAGVVFVVLDWRLAGGVLLGMALALALLAIAARMAVGAAVRRALGAAREAAYRQLFPP